MTDPKVSIIIPIYKTEKYLRDCLLSVQRQTMPDFEALLVNDCTPDGAMEIAREFAQSDSRFQILEHETNLGAGGARNTGIKNASGHFISFLDSDDHLPADAIQLMVNLAESEEADMVIGNMAWYHDHVLTPVHYIDIRLRDWYTFGLTNVRDLPDNMFFSGNVTNRLFTRKLIINNSIRFPTGVIHEDMPFSFETWYFCKRIAYTRRFVVFHTKRDDPENPSLTQTYNEKAFLDRDIIVDIAYNFALRNTDAAQLCVNLLFRILGTTKEMLAYVDEDIKLKIMAQWFPKHLLRINKMVNQLNEIAQKD